MRGLVDVQAQKLHIRVDFFNEDERRKLLSYPTAEQMVEIVAKGVRVNIAQFLTYYLFHRRRPGKEGYRNYTQLSNKIDRAITHLDDWVDYLDGTLVSSSDAEPQDADVTEYIGEAAALSIVGAIHGLHEADWDHIPEHRGRSGFPTFDYARDVSASDGTRIVQVEAKGTSTGAVAAQKTRIDKKKSWIRTQEDVGRYVYPADVRYGVVTSLERRGPLRCLLTDPPAQASEDPRRHRLIARLQFISDWISFLTPRSQLAAALASRVRAVHSLADPFELNGVPLVRSGGEPFDIPELGPIAGWQDPLGRLSRVADGPAVGTVLHLRSDELFFVGVQRSLFHFAASQDFDSILSYSEVGGSLSKTVRCVVPRGRAKTFGLEQLDDGTRNRSYVTFEASGRLHYSHGASVFGQIAPKR